MEKHQNEAYKESVEEYRTATAARLSKLSNGTSNTVVGVLPKRQISNYFVQFRKVLPESNVLFPLPSLDSVNSDCVYTFHRLPTILYW